MCFLNRASRNSGNPFALRAHFILLFFIPNSPFFEAEKYFSGSLDLALGAKYLQINTVKLNETNVNLCPKSNPHYLPQVLPRIVHLTYAAHTPSHYRLPCRSDTSTIIPLQQTRTIASWWAPGCFRSSSPPRRDRE